MGSVQKVGPANKGWQESKLASVLFLLNKIPCKISLEVLVISSFLSFT